MTVLSPTLASHPEDHSWPVERKYIKCTVAYTWKWGGTTKL